MPSEENKASDGDVSNAKDEEKDASEEPSSTGTYIGEFHKDEMHGNGTFLFPDGSEYVGRFAKGLQHGQGFLKLKDGTQMLGQWENGEQTAIEYSIDLHDYEA